MRSARLVSTLAATSVLAVAAGLALAGPASADPLAPKTNFTMVVNDATGFTNIPSDGESVPNIDSVKSTIRAYYNATGGISDKNSSRYITQVHTIEQQVLKSLPAQHASNAAVVFDVDDTLLWTYDYTDHVSGFNFNSATNAAAIAAGFPAVPGMPALLQTLDKRGYAIYGITGRPASQFTDTINNLNAQHYTNDGSTSPGAALFGVANLFTKGAAASPPTTPQTIPSQPWVVCDGDGDGSSCSTVDYKASTRKHIETNDTPAPGDDEDIVMNVGDQWSDLQGGFEDDYTKIPNPTYFLASPDLTTAPASDANMVPPTSYTMAPDGSSGYSVASGDDIPNADPVRKYIRAYYNATTNPSNLALDGIADKVSSPYISQLSTLSSSWATQVASDCTTKAQAHNAAVTKQTTASQAVAAAQAKVTADTAKVAKAKKKLSKAKTPQARKKAHKKLAKARKALKADQVSLATAQDALAAINVPAAPAAVFDADDTTLWNYDLEDNVMRFNFDPAAQQVWITNHTMLAVPGMVAVVKAAAGAGCAIYGVTGRPLSQQADTIGNLTDRGYVDGAGKPLFTAAQFFTKGAVVVSSGSASIPTQPWVDCNADGTRGACSTIEYKAATRGHIEDQGLDIVGNFGDQYSDLIGGFADHTYKVPNPTYYLP